MSGRHQTPKPLPTELRTVTPCYPEDAIDKSKVRGPGEGGGGRPSRAWAYTSAGIAARIGVTGSAVSRISDRLHDPLYLAAVLVVATGKGRIDREQVDRIHALLQTPLESWPATSTQASRAELVEQLRSHFADEAASPEELRRLHSLHRCSVARVVAALKGRLSPTCPEDIARMLDVSPRQAKGMLRALAWYHDARPKVPLALSELTPAEAKAALQAVAAHRREAKLKRSRSQLARRRDPFARERERLEARIAELEASTGATSSALAGGFL